MQYLVSVIDDTAGLATPDEEAAIDARGSAVVDDAFVDVEVGRRRH